MYLMSNRYHGNGNPDSKVVAIELEEMTESISTTGSDKTWWDFRDLLVMQHLYSRGIPLNVCHMD